MRWDDIAVIIFACIAAGAFLALKMVQKAHMKDPHFKEQEQRRKEEYKRRTVEKNREKELDDIINEGYSYGDIEEDDDDDNS